MEPTRIVFEVAGVPKPAGSKRALPIYRGKAGAREFTGRAAVVDSSGQAGKDWRADVAHAARAVMGDRPPLGGALSLDVTFFMARPKGHYGTGRNAGTLRPTSPVHHTIKPDATKLLRAVEDALSGICYFDDDQIVVQSVRKVYVEWDQRGPGCRVVIERIWP